MIMATLSIAQMGGNLADAYGRAMGGGWSFASLWKHDEPLAHKQCLLQSPGPMGSAALAPASRRYD